ncbi:MAG: type III-A CRISPR-associated RAMP protein Csm5 [Clostridiales bacterium]|nr:type III-A CRISPR-associated RAMP protein Csm5 [Clostridiales bacterium]
MVEDKKRYYMRLKVLTPVHIGSGETLSKLEYSYNRFNRLLSVLDGTKFFCELQKRRRLEAYAVFVEKVSLNNANASVYNWLREQFGPKPADEIIRQSAKYEIRLDVAGNKGFNDLRCHIKSIDRPYVPGSSIKGMIRTALLFKYLYENINEFADQKKEIDRAVKSGQFIAKTIGRAVKDIEDNVFGNENDPKSKLTGMSGISVSDSTLLDSGALTVIQKVDYLINKPDAATNPIPVFYECLKEGSVLDFMLDVDPGKTAESKATRGILTARDIIEVLTFQHRKLFYVRDKSPWSNFISLLPDKRKLDGFTRVFLGGNTGYIAHTVIAALYREDIEQRRLVTAGLLHEKFGRTPMGKHLNDRPYSPRTIHTVLKGDEHFFAGMCELSEVAKCP